MALARIMNSNAPFCRVDSRIAGAMRRKSITGSGEKSSLFQPSISDVLGRFESMLTYVQRLAHQSEHAR